MRLLLDTHALIWWFQGSGSMSRAAREAINQSGNTTIVSAVSVFELTTKHRLGKLLGVDELVNDLDTYIARQGFQVLAVSMRHADVAGRFSFPHRDPFDRLLIAQAQVEQAWLVSNEVLFDQFGVRRLW